jgi:hypothetical protein
MGPDGVPHKEPDDTQKALLELVSWMADGAIIARVHPLARCLALSKQGLEPRHYAYEPVQGFRVHLLHEEPDPTFDVFALA